MWGSAIQHVCLNECNAVGVLLVAISINVNKSQCLNQSLFWRLLVLVVKLSVRLASELTNIHGIRLSCQPMVCPAMIVVSSVNTCLVNTWLVNSQFAFSNKFSCSIGT